MGEGQKPVCTIYVTGAFRVESPSGRDITPASKLRCALLAVLATAPDKTHARSYLQSMFWGNSSSSKAAGSLRAAVFQLRKEFNHVDKFFIESHPNHISLRADGLRVECDPAKGEFLEGLDPSTKGADEFERWLQSERISGPPEDEGRDPAQGVTRKSRTAYSAFTLGILPVRGFSGVNEGHADASLDSLIAVLAQVSAISVVDLRGKVLAPGALDTIAQASHSLLLKSAVHETDRQQVLRLSLVEPKSGRTVMTLEPIALFDDATESYLVRSAEMILGTAIANAETASPVNLMPWAALSSLFSLRPNAVASTEEEIERHLETEPVPVLKCLKIFLQIFKDNEGLGDQQIFEVPELLQTLELVPTIDPLRPLCESLIGYAAHMLCAENDLSEFLLETSYERAPNLALNLDHLAALQFARGDLKSAVRSHERCMRLSSPCSWRYSYDITGAMIAMALGDYRTALRRSNQSLMQRPSFIGALRYTMIGFAMNDQPKNARLMKSSIMKLRPNYDLSGWTEAFLNRSDPAFANNVAITLRRQELV